LYLRTAELNLDGYGLSAATRRKTFTSIGLKNNYSYLQMKKNTLLVFNLHYNGFVSNTGS
jgi:hypothetical protein